MGRNDRAGRRRKIFVPIAVADMIAGMDPCEILAGFFPGHKPASAEGIGAALPRAVDRPFGSFFFRGEPCEYDALPPAVQAREVGWVYFGKAAPSLEQARTHAERLFTYGRETRGAAHRDLWKHLQGINQANFGISGFMQTSHERALVEQRYVLGQLPFGSLYVIDRAGAEVLSVDAFCALRGEFDAAKAEGEVLFSGCLPPTRILGVALCHRRPGTGRAEPVTVLLNPNYRTPENEQLAK